MGAASPRRPFRSGATELSALDHAKSARALTGGFHPLQMFANPDVALEGLRGCTVGIEAKPDFRRELELLATSIGCEPLALPAGVRPLYHASAYYVGPFLIALLKEGVELWKSFRRQRGADALRAMMPLLRGTVAAVLDGGLANGMGGCVARGDVWNDPQAPRSIGHALSCLGRVVPREPGASQRPARDRSAARSVPGARRRSRICVERTRTN